MKFIPRGAVRVESRSLGEAPAQVAFRTPDGRLVLLAANPAGEERRFEIDWYSQSCNVVLPPKSVGTWRWPCGAEK